MSLREPAAGSRFGDLEVEAEVGAGAFGRVFRARDTLIDRVVALKVLKKPGDAPLRAGERERFLAEARAVGSFNHPHIVTLYHVHGVEGGGFVLEMEYVDGGSLEDRLAGGERIPPEQALAIARDVAAALGAAHAARVVHGDVKPGNVLTTRDGRVKLVDFGLARFLGAHDPTPGGTGIEGTPYYMAPEVIQGEGYLPASDVWSLGVVLHRMLSGRLPFDAPDFDGLFCAIQNQPPAPLDAPLPARVLSLVHRCLAKRPSERFPDGSALATALSEALDRFATGASVSPAVAAAQQPGLPTLAGRSQETERMVAALHRLRLRTGGLVLVTGPAGLGKSALVGATAVEARRLGVPVVSSRVSAVEGLLRPLAGALGGLGPAAGDPTTTSSGRAAPLPGAEVERALAARAAGEPTVVVLEDLQHASAEDLRTLLRLCRRLSGSAILWLLTERTSDVGLAGSRPPNAQPLLDVPGAVRVDLGPLPPEAIVAVLEGAAERTPFSPDLLDLLVRHSGGNPLFALQWFAHLRERGLAAREGGEWIARDPEAAALAPPEIRGLVRRRVQALPSGTRALLDIAAVDGFEFDGEALAFVLRRPLLTVLRTLQSLFRTHGVVVPREHGYRFASPFLQEVLYEDVAPDLRREIHRRLAEHLEARGGDVDPERVGTHWERGGSRDRAVPWLLRAGRAATAHMETTRALDLARRAGVDLLHLAPELVARELESVLWFISAASDAGRFPEMEAGYASVLEHAARCGDETLRWRTLVRRARSRYLGTGLRPGDENDLRRAAEALPPGRDLAQARYVLGMIEKHRSNLDAAERWLRAADSMFLEVRDQTQHGSCLDQLASVALRRGRQEEAERLYAEAARVCRETGRLSNAAASEVNRAIVALGRGALEGVAERVADAAHQIEVEGNRSMAAHATVVRAHVLYALGDVPAAEAALGSALAVLAKAPQIRAEYPARELEAHLALASGRLDDARRVIGRLREIASGAEQDALLPTVEGFEVWRRLLLGDVPGASELARRTIEGAEQHLDPRNRRDHYLRLASLALWGLPADVLEAMPPAREPVPEAVLPRVVAAAGRALGRPQAGAADLLAGARALRAPQIGPFRAYLRCIASGFEVQGLARAGDAAGAQRALSEGVTAARELGHPTLEMALLRLAPAGPRSGAWSVERGAVTGRVARSLSDASERSAVIATWGA